MYGTSLRHKQVLPQPPTQALAFAHPLLRNIVNGDMVWKLGQFQSVNNELRCYVESASPCTNLLKFCRSILQQYG